jgi:hypothetical membrane protein
MKPVCQHESKVLKKITESEDKKMKKKTGIVLLTGACILMLSAMFILPFFRVPDHSIIRNTLSELGAQFSPYAWIMNSIFAALAVSSVISGWVCYEGFVFQRIILLLFGISLILASIFNHAPVSPATQNNIVEDAWHSYLITTTWLTFIILTFSTAVMQDKPAGRQWSVIAGIASMLLLLLFSEADQTAGLWQRLQFILSSGWMLYTFKTKD